jgi:guanine nucleotide-binding protein G(i) subunit alpha
MLIPRCLMLTSPVYSNTLSEQQRHLETTKTRKFLKRAQVDSVSLLVQRDNASFSSKMTDNLSKISRVFEFDRDVFSTNVYERAFR